MEYMRYTTIALALGIVLDFLLGDPRGWRHPVMAIGTLIQKTEKVLRRIFPKSKRGQQTAGVFQVILVSACSLLVPAVLLVLCYRLHPAAGIIFEMVVCYYMLAAKSLKTESMLVAEALRTEGLCAGQKAVAMIVGRDTHRLDETGVVKAAVETVAENTSDGVIAPLCYMACFGALGGVFYKAVNTMDSMTGYKNEAYQYYGTAAARLDDVLNFIPARICAAMMLLACVFLKLDVKNAWRIFKRDRYQHASPNSAQTEAVMAGALGIQLAGAAWYFGEKHEKPVIGDAKRPVEMEDIARSNRLMYATVLLTALLVLGIKTIVIAMLIRGV